MRTAGYHKVLAPLLVGLLAASVSLLMVGPSAMAIVCGPSWSTVASSYHINKPSAIAAVASNDVWVVGSTKKPEHAIRTGAEHWDGGSWSRVPTPDVGTGANALNGADAVASNDVWAVGYSGKNTLIERWDGTQWRVVTSPNVGTGGENALADVDAFSSTDAWAVGHSRTSASRKSLVQRWNGTSWSIVPSPNPGTLGNSLLGVAAAASDDVWAVGWKNSGDGLQSLLLHYDGTGWAEEVALPRVGTGDNVLTDISAVGPEDVWASGYYVDGAEYKALTLHYDGATWSQVPSPNGAGGTSILMGIDAHSPTNAWAAGFDYRAAPHHYVASTQRWDGSSWTDFPTAISGDGTKESAMYDVAKAPGTPQVWAAGRYGLRLTLGGLTAAAETICPSDSPTATTAKAPAPEAPAQEESGAPTSISARAAEGPKSSPTPTAVPTSSASMAAAASGVPVIAVNRAADAGISETTLTYQAVVADFDNDTRPDIFLGRHGAPPRLYENAGNGRFQETNQGAFAQADRHGCDAADVNADGLKDIFCTEGGNHGTAAKRNELYVQRPDHTFAEQAGQYGVFDPFGRGRSAEFIDANGDGRPDLFVSNNPSRGDGMPSPNRFLTNQLGDAYRYAPAYGLERETSLHGSNKATVGDLDKDGWQDLLMITPQGLRVYHNNQGNGFTEVSASVGLGQSPQDLTLADVNGDGWPDVIEVRSNELSVFVNTDGTFSRAFSTTLEYGFSVAAGDVNDDNRPDLYVMRGRDSAGKNAPDQVYLNGGDGTGFAQMPSIPSTSQGVADFVAPIDHDGNGLTDFLVLNGGGETEVPGPVELIAFFPTDTTTPTDTTSPTVISTIPTANATGILPTTNVTATFSEDMDANYINGKTFKLLKKGSTTKLPAAIVYSASTDTATLDPTNSLQAGVTYKAVITTEAKDLAGNPLDQSSTTTGLQQQAWFFTVSN